MERKKYGPDALNTRSNWLTAARIFAGGLLGYATWKNHGRASVPAAAVFGAIISTDKIDGTWARRDGPTRLGAMLDPLADTVATLGEAYVLAQNGRYSHIALGIMGIRELDIKLLRARLAKEDISLPASPLSKTKAVSQMLDVGVRLFPSTSENKKVTHSTTAVATALTLISWADLRIKAARLRRERKEQSKEPAQELEAA